MKKFVSVFLLVLFLLGSISCAEFPALEPAAVARNNCTHELYLIIEHVGTSYMDAGDAYHHILDVSNARCMSCGKDPIQVAEITSTVPHVWSSNGYECVKNMHTIKQICTPCGHKTSYMIPCNGVHEDILDPTRIIIPTDE